jgi:hypothetical protein
MDKLTKLLEEPTKDAVYRIKGILFSSITPKSSNGSSSGLDANGELTRYILNWAFGRWNFTKVPVPSTSASSLASGTATPVGSDQSTLTSSNEEPDLRLTVVTAKYESNTWHKRIETSGYIALKDASDGILSVKKIL